MWYYRTSKCWSTQNDVLNCKSIGIIVQSFQKRSFFFFTQRFPSSRRQRVKSRIIIVFQAKIDNVFHTRKPPFSFIKPIAFNLCWFVWRSTAWADWLIINALSYFIVSIDYWIGFFQYSALGWIKFVDFYIC